MMTFVKGLWLRSRYSGPRSSDGFLPASGGTPVENSAGVREYAPQGTATVDVTTCAASLSARFKGHSDDEQSNADKVVKLFNSHRDKNQVVFIALIQQVENAPQTAEGAAAQANG
eukprot:TRINITY_DN1501_c4_g1_i2.p2 TRINITY_DN1501_c4_g1~~TRINITY_DN1501_c4_g1_i2.p2  ORF type:complete len:115 (-),score=15.18 TRINITY_DN1501_c4_g1_i2:92-436(-)